MNQNDDKAIFDLMVEWGTTGSTDTFRRSVVEYIATIRQEERRAALAALTGLPARGTMNYRRGYEEGLRDAIRTLEAAANETKGEDEKNAPTDKS